MNHKTWRSLAELQRTPQFEEFLHREFPKAASEFPEGLSRRRWLQLMGASLAMASATGCRWQTEKIAPFAARPTGYVPGEFTQYATATDVGGHGKPLMVRAVDGRPVKCDGNPGHPEFRGGSDVFVQAMPLTMYDPDRAVGVRQREGNGVYERSWADFEYAAKELFAGDGARAAIVLQRSSSPSRQRLLEEFAGKFPECRLVTYEPLDNLNARAGSTQAFGSEHRVHADLAKAKVIVALDADILGFDPAMVPNTLGWVAGRDPNQPMNRLYVVESQYTNTGVTADHRLPLRSSLIGALLAEVESRLGDKEAARAAAATVADGEALAARPRWDLVEYREKFVAALASDLALAEPGTTVIVAGPTQPAAVHAHVHRLNERLGNVGKTVRYTKEPSSLGNAGPKALKGLADAMLGGEIDTVMVLGGNPAYDAPADVDFKAALDKVANTIHLGLYDDETGRRSGWHLPLAHDLECWGDVRTFGGSYCVQQPVIEPLHDGRSAIQILAGLVGRAAGDIREFVHETASRQFGVGTDADWQQLLGDGWIAAKFESATPKVGGDVKPADRAALAEADDPMALEVVFTADEKVYDGRFANNGWLQELPGRITKMTWDSVALLNPHTAEALDVQDGGMVRVEVAGRTLELPAMRLPGQARGSIGLALGLGRTAAGLVGGDLATGVDPVGVNVYSLRTSDLPEIATEVELSPLGPDYELATTQDHWNIDLVGLQGISDRIDELAREGTLAEFRESAEFAKHLGPHIPEDPAQEQELPQLWGERPWMLPESEQEVQVPVASSGRYDGERMNVAVGGNAWGMTVDLNKCTGCNSCVVACQSENNVPVVGKDQVTRGREMHWLRLDRYFHGDPADREVVYDRPPVSVMPVMCVQCENAPCEQVCPVAATVHDDEGLNNMVYNRCIGTRYCGNNCPYKVRRFNFFNYNKSYEAEAFDVQALMLNPEVTVRSRGVMEKCTYCVQRISKGRIRAKIEQRPVRDGDITTACQDACPADAILFGDLNDKDSRVSRLHRDDPRAYYLLADIATKPRTAHLARIRNPHPLLVEEVRELHHGHSDGHGADDHNHDLEPNPGPTEDGHAAVGGRVPAGLVQITQPQLAGPQVIDRGRALPTGRWTGTS